MEINVDTTHLPEVAKNFGLKFVILHGSFATGLSHKDSDLDIAVLGNKEIAFKQLLKLHGVLAEDLRLPASMDLDLKSLDKVDPLFRYEVVRVGQMLYGDPVAYEEYKAFAGRAYEDARPLFDLEHQLVRKFQTHLNTLYAK